MLLNRLEYVLMNNPVRAAIQRRIERPRLLQIGGAMNGGRALEIGCGRGVGVEIILEMFGADCVDGFDLDSRMISQAAERLSRFGSRVNLWVGDATAIDAPDAQYDAVFDFGILHHVPDWLRAVSEIHRVLKPGGRFYGEEVLGRFLMNPAIRSFFAHPREDRFSRAEFLRSLEAVGFHLVGVREIMGCFAWFVAHKEPVS
jgi:ubiquinone/menaquinone biosynthesis C-methylase UbiE